MRRPRSSASSARIGSTSAVVSFAPSPNATATPASTASRPVSPSSRHAATTGNAAATRSFCAVVAWSAISVKVASRNDAQAEGRTPKPTPPRRPVDGDEDRQLRDVLRQRVEHRRARGREQEEDLLLGERLELVDPVGRRVRHPEVAAVLHPRGDARQVVGERVVVVRRHRDRQHELVDEHHRDGDQEERRLRPPEHLARRRPRARKRHPGPAANKPDDDRGQRARALRRARAHRGGRRGAARARARRRRRASRAPGRRRGASRRGCEAARPQRESRPTRSASGRRARRSRVESRTEPRVHHLCTCRSPDCNPRAARPLASSPRADPSPEEDS